jgi:hypothetical protein
MDFTGGWTEGQWLTCAKKTPELSIGRFAIFV